VASSSPPWEDTLRSATGGTSSKSTRAGVSNVKPQKIFAAAPSPRITVLSQTDILRSHYPAGVLRSAAPSESCGVRPARATRDLHPVHPGRPHFSDHVLRMHLLCCADGVPYHLGDKDRRTGLYSPRHGRRSPYQGRRIVGATVSKRCHLGRRRQSVCPSRFSPTFR
jgi:hypothetical protein